MDTQALREAVEPWLSNAWVRAGAVMLASIVVAKLSDLIVTRVLRRLTAKTLTEVDDKIIGFLHRPIFLSVGLLGLRFASQQLELSAGLEHSIARLLKTIAVLLWATVGIRIVGLILEVFSQSKTHLAILDKTTFSLFNNVARAILFGAAAYFVLLSWDVDPTGWVVVTGAISFAIGFGAQDTISNLFAGLFILADKPYKVGDFLNLDSGERGEVTNIGLRSTRLLTRDDTEISIPNAVMAQAKITNETGGPSTRERIRIAVGVAYGSDIDQVEQVLLDIAEAHPDIASDPFPRVRLRLFGESSLDFELLGWISEPVQRGRVKHELLREVYKAFQAQNIEIPYPKRDLYIHNAEAPNTQSERSP